MGKKILQRLEAYKKKNNLSDTELAKRLKVYYNYLYRWRKSGRIIGIYEKYVEEFLDKEAEKQGDAGEMQVKDR